MSVSKKILFRFRLSAIVAFFMLSTCWSSECYAQFAKIRREVTLKFEIEQFRFFYNVEGKHAVRKKDTNQNRIPDQVEDVAKQTWAAHKIFVETLGFPDPLKSERYKKAKFVDVIFLSRKTVGRNATAYDGLQEFGRANDPPNLRTLCFDISSDINAIKNPTPTHEYFHLIQNGATFFKTRWYTEGMARWSEHATDRGALGKIKYNGGWPQSLDIQQELFNLKDPYSSEFGIWNPLAKMDDKVSQIAPDKIDKTVRSLRYSNGAPVVADLNFCGAELMREILFELGKQDDIAFKELGYREWSEDNQKSLNNGPYIYQSIMKVARLRGHNVGEYGGGNESPEKK